MIFRKSMRNGDTDIEDCLHNLDKLTQEEARMVSAEVLRVNHSIDGKVMTVDNGVKLVGDSVKVVEGKVQGVRGDVQDVSNKVQGIGASVRNHLTRAHYSESSDGFTGNQLSDSLLKWLSPPDPSVNHNIACKARHGGTAEWFFQGSIFKEWKS